MDSLANALDASVLPMAARRAAAEQERSTVRVLPLMLDTCSCFKEPGCCGREGWHFRPFGERDIEREIDRALAALPPGSPDADRSAVERNARQCAAHYVGLQIAYEPCESYRSAMKSRAEDRRREGRKANDLVGDL